MISYNHDSKETVLEIRDRLKTAGINYWIDEENMCMYQHFTRVSSELFATNCKLFTFKSRYRVQYFRLIAVIYIFIILYFYVFYVLVCLMSI